MSTLTLLTHNIKKQKLGFTVLIMSSLFGAFQQCLTPWMMKNLLNNISRPLENHTSIENKLIFFFLFYITSELIIRSQGFLIANIIPQFKKNIKASLVEKLLKKDMHYFNNISSGKIVQEIQDFTSSSERIFQIIIYNFFSIFISISVTIILLFLINPAYGFFLMLWFSSHIFSTYFRFKKSIGKFKEHSSIHGAISGNLNELLSAISTVKIACGEKFESKRLFKLFTKENTSLKKTLTYFEKVKFSQSLISILFLICITAHQLHGLTNNMFNSGDFIFVVFSTYNLINYVWFSSFQLTVFIKELGVVNNSYDLLHSGQDEYYNKTKKEIKTSMLIDPDLSIKNLVFSFGPHEKIIKNLSVNIPFGSKILIKGASGSGKSTMSKLIFGLYTNYTGTININQTNIKSISREKLAKLVQLVEQSSGNPPLK